MPIYLAYETAVEAIALLRSREKDATPWRRPSRKRSITDAIHTKRELTALIAENDALLADDAEIESEQTEEPDDDDLFFLDELTDLTQEEAEERETPKPADPPTSILRRLKKPLHVLVPERTDGTRTGTLVPHVWSGPIPLRSFIQIEPGVFLSTPAFTFLQMATEMTRLELVKMAMEFCGFYARDRESGGYVFQIDPVCSVKTLGRFVSRAKGYRGAKPASAALNYVCDHAASHMETALYLLLCLPLKQGGYGLPKPELNPKVVVRQASGPSTCYPDLYWRGLSIDVEYDSDAEHSGPSAHYKDSKRMVAIVCNKISYLSISTGQLNRAQDLDNVARGLARMLKRRIRIIDEMAWKKDRMLLRAALLPYQARYAEVE